MNGLDNVCPFSDTIGMQTVLHDAERMLSPGMEIVGQKNVSRIWGFVSKFVMVDHFARTKFGSEFLQQFLFLGIFVWRNLWALLRR